MYIESHIIYAQVRTKIVNCKSVNILLSISLNVSYHRDGSFEYPQHKFWLSYKTIFNYALYPVADLGGGGCMGAQAPPAESMVKNLTYLFSSHCTVGTFLRVL